MAKMVRKSIAKMGKKFRHFRHGEKNEFLKN